MKIYLHEDSELLHELVNKQFEMIGAGITLKEIQQKGGIIKKKGWWNSYKFDSQDQYNQWFNWALEKLIEELEGVEAGELDRECNHLELVYGLEIKLKKEA